MTTKHIVDPQANLLFSWDWDRSKAGAASGTGWLASGEVISSSTWAITPTGPTLSQSQHTETQTTVRATGFTLGVTYRLTNHVVSNLGNEDDRSHIIRCVNR